MITVYTKPACQQCEATKKELARRGIEFDFIDVTQDVSAYDKIVDMGYKSMPVVITEKDHWSGFRVDKLATL